MTASGARPIKATLDALSPEDIGGKKKTEAQQ
jgi:hypothetical protein